jgi:lysophospholipase L1-like esterase
MKFKRLSILLTLMLAFSTFFTSFAFAEENIDKPNLVALGDSITFGLRLEATQTQASPNAFPSLIGNGEFNVINLGVPKLTSLELATKLSTPDAGTLLALNTADIFTLYIGGNDLLEATGISAILNSPVPVILTPEKEQELISKAIGAAGAIVGNLRSSIDAIRLKNETAPIILYNFYNPIPDVPEVVNPLVHNLHLIGNKIINQVNADLINPIANKEQGVFLANAYTAFDGEQAQYMLPGDVHPNILGHQVLAKLGTDVLLSLIPELTLELTATPTEPTTGSVTIKVNTNAEEVLVMKWFEGENQNGTDIVNNEFQVTENGTYTVYVVDGFEQEAVQTITIENIKEETPVVPDPTPTPTPTPTPVTNTPAPTPTPVTSTPAPQVKATGYAIPNTASPAYNFVAIGSVVLLAGFVTLTLQRRRKQEI